MSGKSVHHSLKRKQGRALLCSTKFHLQYFKHQWLPNSNLTLLKRKFMKRRRRQREFDRIVDQVLAQNKDGMLVIGMGNSRNLSGLPGTPPSGPAIAIMKHARKRLKNKVNVIDIDEFNTTKLSTCCYAPTIHSSHQQQPIHGILHCTQCGTTLCRDTSAATNILKIALIETGTMQLPHGKKIQHIFSKTTTKKSEHIMRANRFRFY